MKFALVENIRKQPLKGSKGRCIGCGQEVVAKCGDVKIHHWAHKGVRKCDPWWENETEWHRGWKNKFPLEWQEIAQRDEDGIMHIADIKRPDGFFIEFQNSPISKEEVESRNKFYKNLIWVVNGNRYISDYDKFQDVSKNISDDRVINISNLKMNIVKRWKNIAPHVFIDFYDQRETNQKRIFYLTYNDRYEFLHELLVDDFVDKAMASGDLSEFVKEAKSRKDSLVRVEEIAEVENNKKVEASRLAREVWEKEFITPFLDRSLYKKKSIRRK